MATDYYPRLSAVANDNKICKRSVNQQAEISILIIAPILLIFLVFINWVTIFLYSQQFTSINVMIHWAALGIFFKAVSWSIAFIILAKGQNKLFFWNELITNIYMLLLNLLGYYLWGLTGLGISYAVAYFLYLLQIYFISKIKFNFYFDSDFFKIFGLQFFLAIVCFLVVSFMPKHYYYVLGSGLIVLSMWYSIMELDKRLGLLQVIKKFLI